MLNPLPSSDTSYIGYVARDSAGALLVSNGLPGVGGSGGLSASQPRRGLDRAPRHAARLRRGLRAAVAQPGRARHAGERAQALPLPDRPGRRSRRHVRDHRSAAAFPRRSSTASRSRTPLNSGPGPDGASRRRARTRSRCRSETGGVLAIGVAMAADEPSGVRLGARRPAPAPTFISYVTLDVPDTGSLKQSFDVASPGVQRYLRDPRPRWSPTSTFLTVGGEPSVAGAAPVRSAGADRGLRDDRAGHPRADPGGHRCSACRPIRRCCEAHALFADLGAQVARSRRMRDSSPSDTIPSAASDTVRLDVTTIVRLWQSDQRAAGGDLPLAAPRSRRRFTRPVFGSTRSGTVGAPRLRITYLKPFPFENP